MVEAEKGNRKVGCGGSVRPPNIDSEAQGALLEIFRQHCTHLPRIVSNEIFRFRIGFLYAGSFLAMGMR